MPSTTASKCPCGQDWEACIDCAAVEPEPAIDLFAVIDGYMKNRLKLSFDPWSISASGMPQNIRASLSAHDGRGVVVAYGKDSAEALQALVVQIASNRLGEQPPDDDRFPFPSGKHANIKAEPPTPYDLSYKPAP